MYVMESCPYCAHVMKQVEGNPNFKVIDIGNDVHDMKEFLNLRDNNPAFAEEKTMGDVCIPCYVREDDSVTLMSSEVGLEPLEDSPTPSKRGETE